MTQAARIDHGSETFTIIAGAPNSLVAEIPYRMPVILDPADWDEWLTGKDPAALQKMLQPFPAQLVTAMPISTKVNSAKRGPATAFVCSFSTLPYRVLVERQFPGPQPPPRDGSCSCPAPIAASGAPWPSGCMPRATE